MQIDHPSMAMRFLYNNTTPALKTDEIMLYNTKIDHDSWFKISAYYRSEVNDGVVIVWPDDKEIFHFENIIRPTI